MRVTPTDTVMRLVEQLRVQAERGREREREQESAAAAVQQALTRQLADASSRHKEALQLLALKERECHEHEWVIEGLQEKVEATEEAVVMVAVAARHLSVQHLVDAEDGGGAAEDGRLLVAREHERLKRCVGKAGCERASGVVGWSTRENGVSSRLVSSRAALRRTSANGKC